MSEYVVIQVLRLGRDGEGAEMGRVPTLEEALAIGRSDDPSNEAYWFRVYRNGKMAVEARRVPRALVWDDEQQKYVPTSSAEAIATESASLCRTRDQGWMSGSGLPRFGLGATGGGVRL